MDYSAANTGLWGLVVQLGAIAGVLLLSLVLLRYIPILRKTLIPTAVLAGFLLLILRVSAPNLINLRTLEMITYHGIALGFIALTLRIPAENAAKDKLSGPKSGALIVSCYTIQGIIGLLISMGLAYTIKPDMFKAAGILLPMGYGQGPGQANNIGSMYENLGFLGGRSFGLSIAAAGYLSACVVGVIYLNILQRRGRIKTVASQQIAGSVTTETLHNESEIELSESVDKLSLQLALVLGVYILTYFSIRGLTLLTANLGNAGNTISAILWGFNFIVGTLWAMGVRWLLKSLQRNNLISNRYQNNYLLSRISGLAFDVMIIAGIASIDFGELKGLLLPFLLMAVGGAFLTLVYLQWISKKVYAGYYYEGMFSMYGMMTGTISSGILLLREIDPAFNTPAANNLIVGSGMAVFFGVPMLALIGLAPGPAPLTWLVLGLLAVYTVLLVLFLLKFKAGKKDGANAGAAPE